MQAAVSYISVTTEKKLVHVGMCNKVNWGQPWSSIMLDKRKQMERGLNKEEANFELEFSTRNLSSVKMRTLLMSVCNDHVK